MRSLGFAAALAVLAGLLAISGAEAAGYDWPQWRGPGRDGISSETGLLKSWPEGGPLSCSAST